MFAEQSQREIMRNPNEPGYWMHETSGILRPVIEAFLNGTMKDRDVPILRVYFQQWITSGAWAGDLHLGELRTAVDDIRTVSDCHRWIERALDLGIDPL
jgi:hypothetical protein